MKRLLAIEFYKVKHHRLSKILFIAYFFLLSSIALIAAIKIRIGEVKIDLAEQGIFNFPYIWHFNTYVADFFTFFLAIIVVSMVTNEYGFRTLKQNLIDGMSKKEFILSKFVFLVALSALATLFVFIISMILGLMYSDYTSAGVIFSDLEFFLAFFLKILGIFSFILFLGFLFKRSAFALGFFFIWMAVEGIIYGLMRWKFFNEKIADSVIDFFPYNSIRHLLPEPVTRMSAVKEIGKKVGEDIDKFEGLPTLNFIIVAAWIAIFIWGSYKLLQRRDL